MSRQVTIQTKLQEEEIVVKILEKDLKVPFYFREASDQRKLCVDSPVGPLEFVIDPDGFKLSEDENNLPKFEPFLKKLQQHYSLERIKKIASKAGYSIGNIEQGNQQEMILEVTKWN